MSNNAPPTRPTPPSANTQKAGTAQAEVSRSAALSSERNDEESRFRPISTALIFRLLACLKPYWRLYALSALLGILSLGCELAMPKMTQYIIDLGIPSGQWRQILSWSEIWAALAAGMLLLQAGQIACSNRCGEMVIQDLRLAVFTHMQRLSMTFYDRTKLGRIITRGTSDMDALRATVVSGINTPLFNFLLMVGAMIMFLSLADRKLFLSVAWLAPVLAVCNLTYRRKIAFRWQMVRAGYSRLASNLAENVTGVRVVSAFNRQDVNLNYFNELQAENTANNLRAANINGIYQPILEFIRFAGQVIILSYGGWRVLGGELSTGKVIALLSYWNMFMRPTQAMGEFYNTLMQAMASSERIFALLDMQPEIKDKPDSKPLPRLKGHVVFDHVTFGYEAGKPVLHDICLEIQPGQTCALVGATGSGKSSIVSLLCRFYEFREGQILADNFNIQNATLESLHRQMGLVLQSNYLFSGTILDNIRYPRPETSEDEVIAAAKALDIHDAFMSLPLGYQTSVGERGSSLSMGLRQLVCFTRVLVANPSLLLLDEATSSIDAVTEMKVQNALAKLVQGRTAIIVAHRLSTIVKADCILVLDKGRIVERGRHYELLAAKGPYATLYENFVARPSDEEWRLTAGD